MEGVTRVCPGYVEEGILRIGDLGLRRDTWWHLPDAAVEQTGDSHALMKSLAAINPAQAAEQVANAVEAALDTLVTTAIPFVEALALRCCGSQTSPRSVT